MRYPDFITTSVDALINELIKTYPNLLKIKYNDYNVHEEDSENISTFRQRMEMGLYIELVRARLIK